MKRIQVTKEARDSFARVFEDWSGKRYPFRPVVAAASLLWPCEYVLAGEHRAAVIEAARQAGATRAYAAIVEHAGDFFSVPEEQYGGLFAGDIADDDGWQFIEWVRLHTATWSAAGDWGVLVSDGGVALVGGPKEFVEALHAAYPRWQEDRLAALDHITGFGGGEWLEGVVSRLTSIGG